MRCLFEMLETSIGILDVFRSLHRSVFPLRLHIEQTVSKMQRPHVVVLL